MDLQILDMDYVMVNEKPVIRIFGKDANGKTVCVFYDDYMPYFYVKEPSVKEAVESIPEAISQVVKVEEVKRNLIFQDDPEHTIYRITIKNPAKTPEIRDRLRERGMTIYEADIPYKYRFMCDKGLAGMEWAHIEEGNGASTNTVNADSKIQARNITPLDSIDEVPLKIMAFDIECVPTVSGNVPEATRDPIILISLVFNTEYQGKKSIVLSTKHGSYTQDFSTEKELLEEFVRIVNDYDPDVLTGYNANNFDFPYILQRMRKEGVKPVFGRCAQKSVVARKLGNRHKISISGRVIVDSFEIIKKDFSLHRYSLDDVSNALLGEKKVSVKHSEIEKLWEGSDKDLDLLVNYCRKDSVLALNLVVKLNLLKKYIALSRISGTLLQDTLDSGETTRIENYLLREFNKNNYVMPIRPDDAVVARRMKARKKELIGGYVIEPEKGLHNNVAVLDFKSMYPSIIRTFNICPTTLTKSGRQGLVETASGARFFPKEERQGIIPTILENLMNSRSSIKKQIKDTKDEEKKRLLDAHQWALKILANAFYGHMGYARAKIYNMDIANAITGSGRKIIQDTSKEVEKKFHKKIVYGDTDSVFVKMEIEDMDELGREADRISEYITKQLPGVMELEFEKVFKRFLPLTKKRYAAWKFERTKEGWKEGIEMKGIETVRRDWCPLVSETLKTIIETILKTEDVKGAVGFFKNVVHNLTDGKIDIEKLVITKGLTKSVTSYAGVQPHVELVKKMKARNPADAPGIGDRIGYVIIKGMDLVSKRTEDPAYVKERGLQIDPQYYVENQLLPPIERIFGALDISKSELLGNGKQMGLMDVLNGMHKKPKSKPPGEANIKDVNGFVCQKCSKFYSRVPLVGICECGGSMLFSTSRGPAKYAKF